MMMKKLLILMLLAAMAGLSVYGQRTFTAEEARSLFMEKYQMVFGDEGSTLHYAVNIIGIYKTEGTIWYKQGKSKFVDEKYNAWNDGSTYTRVERSKRKVDIYSMVITLKAKKGVKGIKEAKCYIDKETGYPESVRVKIFIFTTTIKITGFHHGVISDDIFVFPASLYADYTVTDHRK